MKHFTLRQHRSHYIFWLGFFFLKLLIFLAMAPYEEIDTGSYFVYPFAINKARTPIYPLLCYMSKLLMPGNYFALIAWVQFIVSCFSCYFIYRAFSLVQTSDFIAKIAVCFYGFNIAVFPWDSILLTESLSLSCTALYVYFCARLTSGQAFSQRHAFSLQLTAISALTLIMLFLRPTFLVLIPISCFLCCYAAATETGAKTKRFVAIGGVYLVVVSMVLGYAASYNQKYDYFTLSSTLTCQQYYQIIETGLYKNIPANEITAYIDSAGPEADPLALGYQIVELFPADEVKGTLQAAIRSNPLAYLAQRVNAYAEASSLPYGRRPHYSTGLLMIPGFILSGISYILLPPIPFGFGVPLACIGLAVGLFLWLRRKNFDIILLGTAVYILFTTISTMFGTMADYARTAISCFPFLCVLTLRLLNHMHLWHIRRYSEMR